MEPSAASTAEDFAFGDALLGSMHKKWIWPELVRRFGESGPPPDFRIFECLIRLPLGQPAIVELNEQVRWLTLAQKPRGRAVRKGELIYLHDIEKILAVEPPSIDGERVPYFYLCRSLSNGFVVAFDATPSGPAKGVKEWTNCRAVCDYLNVKLLEQSLVAYGPWEEMLAAVGLWAAPSLMPYPLSMCLHKLSTGHPLAARQVVVDFCSAQWLRRRLAFWIEIPQLAQRRIVLEQALVAHARRQYALVIPAILPQLEGVMTDWMIANLPRNEIPWRHESKLKKLRDSLTTGDSVPFVFRRAVESMVDFFVEGPVLSTFKKWEDQPGLHFPNRHAVGHGKYDPTVFSKENSIKAFLLLDSLASIIHPSRCFHALDSVVRSPPPATAGGTDR